ncbi:cell wall hydrolase [Acetivibrio sp. MSJd-27]|uniref:cell wall hydrolase n=1 Tax=Acetivibrio sp. MSJd-27 TaxID=2841523 RepID=UPI001C1283D3|nr:cell wall hydrolase [Acetivibrio sp. MSJd-27]
MKQTDKRTLLFLLAFAFILGGIKMLASLESPVEASPANTSDTQLLARCVNGEARGEPFEGQVAVAAVILNRVKHASFPNTIPGVIYQPGAFTAVSDGQINVPIDPNSSVYKACESAMNGWDPSEGAIYYYNPSTATNKWIFSRPLIKTIGKHRFCN